MIIICTVTWQFLPISEIIVGAGAYSVCTAQMMCRADMHACGSLCIVYLEIIYSNAFRTSICLVDVKILLLDTLQKS